MALHQSQPLGLALTGVGGKFSKSPQGDVPSKETALSGVETLRSMAMAVG